jgi:DNA-binding transcriptional LysR family regulator
MGMTVFERTSGGVRATRAGRDFLRESRSILEQIDMLVRHAHSTGTGETGRLAIGLFTSLSAGNLRAALMEYAQRFPQVDIYVIEGSRTRLVRALRNGVVDIAIVTGEIPLLDCRATQLWSERIMVALPEGHRLASNRTIHWSDLKGETLLMTQHDPGPEIQNLISTRLASPDDRPKVVHHDVSRGNIKSLVGAGFGISLMTESCIGANFVGLVYREAFDDNGEIRIGYSAHWREENDNPALASFLKLLGERYPLPLKAA